MSPSIPPNTPPGTTGQTPREDDDNFSLSSDEEQEPSHVDGGESSDEEEQTIQDDGGEGKSAATKANKLKEETPQAKEKRLKREKKARDEDNHIKSVIELLAFLDGQRATLETLPPCLSPQNGNDENFTVGRICEQLRSRTREISRPLEDSAINSDDDDQEDADDADETNSQSSVEDAQDTATGTTDVVLSGMAWSVEIQTHKYLRKKIQET